MVSDPLVEVDGAGVVRRANAAATARFGPLAGRDLSELFRPGDAELVERIFAGGMEESLDRPLHLLAGGTVSIRAVLPDPGGHLVLVFAAPTGPRPTADGLAQERFAQVGRIASALAHELNNPLTVVQLRTDLLLEEAALLPSVADALRDQAGQLAQAIARFTKTIRMFQRVARPARRARERLDLSVLLHGAHAAAGTPAGVTLEPVPSGFLVLGDAEALGTALELLLAGAPAGVRVGVEGFEHTVRITFTGVTEAPAAPRADRGWAREPERAVDQAPALAAAVAEIVARDHGGGFRTLERGTATVLHLELPRASTDRSPGAVARVVVVDDEPWVTAVLAEWCHRRAPGCQLVTSAEEAMAVVREGLPIDLLLLDDQARGRQGRALLDWLGREHPALLERTVLMSGSAPPALPAGVRFLAKPFTRRELGETVGAMLAPGD